MWVLRNTDDPASATFRVSPGSQRTLGRSSRADFVVDGGLLSRLHCRFNAIAPGELTVEDLNSTNGTFVNGRRVVSATLVHGDRLRVGSVELTIAWEDSGT